MEHSLSRLPDAELEVMQALWDSEPWPAYTFALMPKLQRDWKLPTLLKLLSRLEERGFVQKEGKEGRFHGFTPLVSREEYLRFESRSFLRRLHGGSLSSLIAALAPDTKLNEEDREALERILQEGGE